MKSLPLIVALPVLVLASAPARAGERACGVETMVVESDAAVRARFPALGDEIRSAFSGRSDIDACARIGIRSARGKITLDVELPDGRNASRVVTRSEDVVPTLAALLVVPRAPAPAPEPELESEPEPEPEPDPAPASVAPVERATPAADRPVASPAEHRSPTQLGFELAALAGARVGDDHVGAGAGLQSFMEVRGWLIGFGARYDQYLRNGEISVTPALQGALLSGRRLRFGSMALDVIAGAALVSIGASEARQRVATPRGVVERHEETERTMLPRVLAATRVNFAMRSILRPFLAFEAELGPRQVEDTTLDGTARIPLWTVGLALGGTVGTR